MGGKRRSLLSLISCRGSLSTFTTMQRAPELHLPYLSHTFRCSKLPDRASLVHLPRGTAPSQSPPGVSPIAGCVFHHRACCPLPGALSELDNTSNDALNDALHEALHDVLDAALDDVLDDAIG
ncbi:hypothetical protein HDK90DRAFT_122536 [Phyllosticta capitalensis]|uniref:Uncharacterized protein n=1 Tax=Phyllosticta capitalensis TaxID=121624 RepID=A0ABR1YY03_9PEZI